MGYYNYMKLNVESMILKTEANRWYSIDLIINWDLQWVTMYVDQEAQSAQPFFIMRNTHAKDANALSIYTLTPGATSLFRNIMVCDVACNLIGTDESLLVDAFGAVTNSAAAVTAAISALVFSLF